MAEYNINWDKISEWEGGRKLEGYVPEKDGKAIERSGVTIATGIDLGDKNRKFFERLNVPKNIIDKLAPYFGLKGEAAKKVATNLILPDNEAKQLDEIVKPYYAKSVAKTYEQFSQGKKFTDLDKGQQTVLTSVGFQHGSSFVKRDKKTRMDFIKQAGSGDWNAVYNNLMNFGDMYGPRREQEAAYLREEMAAFEGNIGRTNIVMGGNVGKTTIESTMPRTPGNAGIEGDMYRDVDMAQFLGRR